MEPKTTSIATCKKYGYTYLLRCSQYPFGPKINFISQPWREQSKLHNGFCEVVKRMKLAKPQIPRSFYLTSKMRELVDFKAINDSKSIREAEGDRDIVAFLAKPIST